MSRTRHDVVHKDVQHRPDDPTGVHGKHKLIGKLVHGVGLAHEEWWIARGAAMRQPGEDQVYIIVFFHREIPHSDEQS